MKTSVKMSKKSLKEMAENLDAEYLGGDVYNYENIVYFIGKLLYGNKENIEECRKEILEEIKARCKNKELIGKLEKIAKSKKYLDIVCWQIAYSAGIYGNSGQMHKIEIKENCNLVDAIYVYYC